MIFTVSNTPPGFYVYAYMRKDNTPYYIGKGKKARAWRRNPDDIQPPHDPKRIIIIECNLTNIGALAIERRLVRWYGRKDTNTGILRNRSDGGDGSAGRTKTIPPNTGKICWNNGKVNKFSETSPGDEWVLGLIQYRKTTHYSTGCKWWNNGSIDKFSKIQPGPEWILGKLSHHNTTGYSWWNNGEVNTRAKDCPGEGWVSGPLANKASWWNNGEVDILTNTRPGPEWIRGKSPGMVFWTNGEINKMSKVCPGEGWRLGRVRKNSIGTHS